MGSGSVGVSGECSHNKASALQLRFLRWWVMMKLNRVKNRAQRA